MSEDKPNMDDSDSENLVKNTISEDQGPARFEELPNLEVSRRIEAYKDSGMEALERSRGILSKTDRDYLLGLKKYDNKQSEANRRQDIRNRIKNSLQDFKIIWPLLGEQDRDQIFNSLDDKTVDDYIEAVISFIYLGLDGDIPRIESVIKKGILAGENISSEGETKQIDVSINIDHYPDVEDAKEKLQNSPLVEFTVEEIGVLAKAGELDPSHIEKMNDSYIHPPSKHFDSREDEPTVDKDLPIYGCKEADEDPD